MIFKIVSGTIILAISGVILYSSAYLRGHDDGYYSAMFDVTFSINGKKVNPEEVLERRFCEEFPKDKVLPGLCSKYKVRESN